MVHRSGSTLIIAPTTNDPDKDDKLCETTNPSTKSSSSSSSTNNIKKEQKNSNLLSKTTQRRKLTKEIPDVIESNRQSINEKTPTKSLPLNSAATTSTTNDSIITPIRRGRSYSVVTPSTETKRTNKKTQSIKNLNTTPPPPIIKNRNRSIDRESTTSTSSSSTITTTISNIEKETSSSCSSLSSSNTISSSIIKNITGTSKSSPLSITKIRSGLRSNSLERTPEKITNLAGLKVLNTKKSLTTKIINSQNDDDDNNNSTDDGDDNDIKSIKKCKSVESIFDNLSSNNNKNDIKIKTDNINFDQLPKLKLKCSVPLERISGILNSLNFNKYNPLNRTEIDDSGGGDNRLTTTSNYEEDYDDDDDDDEDFEKDTRSSHNSLNSSDNNSSTTIINSIKTNNQQQQKSLCLYCDKKFSSHKIRITHTERVHKISKGRRISSRTSLLSSSNLNLISTGGAIQLHPGCSYCCKNNNNSSSNSNSTITTLTNNNNSNQQKQENLTKISRTISNDLKSLFNHMCDYHSDKYFACKQCAIRFQNLEQLNEHNDIYHKDNNSTILGKNRLKRNLGVTTTSLIAGSSIKLENELNDGKLNQPLRIDTDLKNDNNNSNLDGNFDVGDNNNGDIENTPTKTRRQLKQAMENHNRSNSIVSITSTTTTTTLLTRSAASLLQQNNVFRGVGDDTTILSRLGVVQNRLPRGRKGAIRNRSTRQTLTDTIKQDIVPQLTVKTRSKVGFCKLTSNEPTATITLPETVLSRQSTNNRTEPLCCTFDDDFYETVSLNVRKNLTCHLDGKLDCNPTTPSPISPVTTIPTIRSTVVKSPLAPDSEIHEATALAAITAFPTLLTAEQFGSDLQSTSKIKRPITRHSWKWKWDSVKKYKYVNEGGKIVKKIKQPITGLRDLSKLDMWTQLTMRTKHELKQKQLDKQLQICTTISQSITTTATATATSHQDLVTAIGEQARETKRKQIDQLNMILDERRLPQINLEQSEQTIIKIEPEIDSEEIINFENLSSAQFQLIGKNEIDMIATNSNQISKGNVSEEDNFPQMLNLFPANRPQISQNENIILSGEWARPRCYICYGCGAKFDKLKTLEEHKMFRHPYVYSTHYEIVGRELIAGDLYKHFYIPTKALNRLDIKNPTTPMKSITKLEDGGKLTSVTATPTSACGEDESMDSVQSVSNRSLSVASKSDCDTDSKATTVTSRSSTIYMSTRSSTVNNLEDSNNSSNALISGSNGEILRNCSKCKRECGGILELYRHLLDCSGDYAWILAKKKKYRYFGVKRRRTAKHGERKKKSSNQSSTEEGGPPKPKYIYNPLAPRPPRPSDAESIRRMLENLPAKRSCRKLIPEITKKPRNNKNLTLKKSILVKKSRNGGIGISSNIVNKKKLRNKLSTSSTVTAISKNILRNHKKQILTRHLRDISRNKKENSKNLSPIITKQTKNEEMPDIDKVISITADENTKKEESKKAADNFTKKTKRFVKKITQKLKPKKKTFLNKKIATRSSANISNEISNKTETSLKDDNSSSTQQNIGEKDLQIKLKKLSKTNTLLKKLSFRKKNDKAPPKLIKIKDENTDGKSEHNSERLDMKMPKLIAEKCDEKSDTPKQKVKKIKKILNRFSSKSKNSVEETANSDESSKSHENLELQPKMSNENLSSTEKIPELTPPTTNDLQTTTKKSLDSTEDLSIQTKVNNEDLQQDSSTNFETSPTTKRRSKKLNDCIAMLTGKLQEKLGKSSEGDKNIEEAITLSQFDSLETGTTDLNIISQNKNEFVPSTIDSTIKSISAASSLNNLTNINCDNIANSTDSLNQSIKSIENTQISTNFIKKNTKRKSTTQKFIKEDSLTESLQSLTENSNKIDLIESENVTKVVSEISKSLENIKEISKDIKETLHKPVSASCSNLTNINQISIHKSESQLTTSRRSTRSKLSLQITQPLEPAILPLFMKEAQKLQNFDLPASITAYPLKVPEHFNSMMTKNVNEIVLQKGNKLSNDLIISPILPIATNQIQFNEKKLILPSPPPLPVQSYQQPQLRTVSTNQTGKKTLTAAQKKSLPSLPIQPLPQPNQQLLLQQPAPHIVHTPIKPQTQTAPSTEQFAIDLSISQQRSTEATLLSFMDFDDAPLDLSKKSSTSLPATPVTTPQMLRRTRNSTKPHIAPQPVPSQPQLVPENLSLNLKPLDISANLPTINTLPIRIPTVCSPVMKNLTSLLLSPPLQRQQPPPTQLPTNFEDEILKSKLFELNAINHRPITELNIPNTNNLTTTNPKKKRNNNTNNRQQQICSKNSADKIDDTITSVILGLDLQDNLKEKTPPPLPEIRKSHNIIEIIKIPPPPSPRTHSKLNSEKPVPFHIPIHYNIPIETSSNKKTIPEINSNTKKQIEIQVSTSQKLNEIDIIPIENNKHLVDKIPEEVEDIEALITRIHHIPPKSDTNKIDNVQSNEIGSTNSTGTVSKSMKRKPPARKKKGTLISDNKSIEMEIGKKETDCEGKSANVLNTQPAEISEPDSSKSGENIIKGVKKLLPEIEENEISDQVSNNLNNLKVDKSQVTQSIQKSFETSDEIHDVSTETNELSKKSKKSEKKIVEEHKSLKLMQTESNLTLPDSNSPEKDIENIKNTSTPKNKKGGKPKKGEVPNEKIPRSIINNKKLDDPESVSIGNKSSENDVILSKEAEKVSPTKTKKGKKKFEQLEDIALGPENQKNALFMEDLKTKRNDRKSKNIDNDVISANKAESSVISSKLRKGSKLLEPSEIKKTLEKDVLENDENITKKVTRNSHGNNEKIVDKEILSSSKTNKKYKKTSLHESKQLEEIEIENTEDNLKKGAKKSSKNKNETLKKEITPEIVTENIKKLPVKGKKGAKKLFEEDTSNEQSKIDETFNTEEERKNSEKLSIMKNVTDDLNNFQNNKKTTKSKTSLKENKNKIQYENCSENQVQTKKNVPDNVKLFSAIDLDSLKTSTPITKSLPKSKKLSRADAEIIENSFKDIQPIMNSCNISSKDKKSATITKAERKSFNDRSFLLETVDISPVLSSTRRSNRNRSQGNEIPRKKEVEAIAASFLIENDDDEDDDKPLISSSNKKSNKILAIKTALRSSTETDEHIVKVSDKDIIVHEKTKKEIPKKCGNPQEIQNKSSASETTESLEVAKNFENQISKCKTIDVEKLKTSDELTNSLRKQQRGRKRKTSEPSKEIVTSEKENQSIKFDDKATSKTAATIINNENSDMLKQTQQISEEIRPDSATKKQRRRRRNELAAIVADQLLESFKEVDKSRIDDLKMLENLAYEKSEDLLLTGMRLTPTTKRKNALAENKESSKVIEQTKHTKANTVKGKSNKTEKSTEKAEKQSIDKERQKNVELDILKKNRENSDISSETNVVRKSNLSKNQTKHSEPEDSNIDEQKSKEQQNSCNLSGNSLHTFRSIREFGFPTVTTSSLPATDNKINIPSTAEPILNKLLPILIETSNSIDSFRFQSDKQNNAENSEKSSKSSLHKKNKKSKKKEKKLEIENINELRSGLESFTFGKWQLGGDLMPKVFGENDKKMSTFSQIKEKSVSNIKTLARSSSPAKENVVDLTESDDLQKNCDKNLNFGILRKPILRPSILAVTLESAVKPIDSLTTNSTEINKTVSSRDPRLNKNKIIQQETSDAMQLKRKSEKQNPDEESDCEELNNAFKGTRDLRLRSSKRVNNVRGPNGNQFKAIGGNESSSDDDNYLAEIAKSVKDKIRGNQDEDFNLANDGFELAKSFLNEIPRPSTSLSMRSAPNFHDDRNNDFDDDDNTNTELIDMDLDDDCSVYTSFSQDVRRKGRRRRRRSILMTRRRSSRASSVAPESNEIFECQLCKKSFKKSQALAKHKMTIAHVSKLSAYEYFNLNATRKQQEEDEKKKKENAMAEIQKRKVEEEKREAEMEVEKEKQRRAEDDLLKRKEIMEAELKQRQEMEKQLKLQTEMRIKEEQKRKLEAEMLHKDELRRKLDEETRQKDEQKRKLEAKIRQKEEEKRKLEEEIRIKNEKEHQKLEESRQISEADVKEVENAVLSIQSEISGADNSTVHCAEDESSSSTSSSSSSSSSSEDIGNLNSQSQQETPNETNSLKISEKHSSSIPPPTISNLLNQSGIEPISSPEQNYDRYPNRTSSSRLALNPEERLFYECCNMLKGSETPMIERSYPIIQPTAYAGFDLPNKPITPKSSERYSYLDGNFHHSAAYTVKSPLSQSRTSPRHAYPKIDVNQFSDISSDSNSGCPKAQPPPNLPNMNYTQGNKYSVFIQSPIRDSIPNPAGGFKNVDSLPGNASNRNYPSYHVTTGETSFISAQQYPGDIGAPNSIPLSARTFINTNQTKYHGNNLANTQDHNQPPNAFTSPAHSTSSQGSTQTTTTTCRMKTKAAMKGYDNFKVSIPTVGLDMQQALERSPHSSGCKLTALAEIALGNEPPTVINSTAQTTTTTTITLSKIDDNHNEETDRDPRKLKTSTINEEFAKKYQDMILNNAKNIQKKNDDKNTTAGKLGFKAKKNRAITKQNQSTTLVKKLNIAETVQAKDIYDFEESEETTNKEIESSLLKVINNKKFEEKIIIPERPFKNIGLNSGVQNQIQFQKPDELSLEKSPNSSIEKLPENDESVVSTTSYSDRDDFNYASMTDNIDDDEADEKSNQGDQDDDDDDDDDDSSSDDSAITSKTLGNKSLIMGRIFKKATTTMNTIEERKQSNLPITVPGEPQQKKKLPKQELDKLFDQLISEKKNENAGKKKDKSLLSQIKTTKINTGKNNEQNKITVEEITAVGSKKRGRPRKNITEENKSEEIKKTTDIVQTIHKKSIENKKEFSEKTEFTRPFPSKQSPKLTKEKLSVTKKQPITKQITKLQSELGMSAEEIAELIGEGKRKSQRRCAANSQKKHVEIWSSDEYEEFLTTKDIIALIEEKEKKIQKKKKDEKLQEQIPSRKFSISKIAERSKQKQLDSDNIANNTIENEIYERGKTVDENLRDEESISEKPQKLVKNQENCSFEIPLSKSAKKSSAKIVDKLLEKFTPSKTLSSKITNETASSAAETLLNNKKANIEKKPINENAKKPLPTLKPRLKARTSDSESDFEAELKGRAGASAKIKKRRKTIATKEDLPPPPPIKRTNLGKSSVISNLNSKKSIEPKINSQEGKTKSIKKIPSSGKSNAINKSPTAKPLARRKRIASEMLYYWSSSSDEEFGRIEQHEDDEDDLTEDGEHLQQHGWIVGDSHKKLVTLLAIAKGNKKVDDCGVKETNSKKKSL